MTAIEQNLPESVSSSPAKTRATFSVANGFCWLITAAILGAGVFAMHSKMPRVYASAHDSSAPPEWRYK
ncbi:MAG TPA: hypothetical protein VHP58_02890 [Alphaproteobacteria bacterium]|nr:hypothetical protein [Alphaproteobacteria bacterium]